MYQKVLKKVFITSIIVLLGGIQTSRAMLDLTEDEAREVLIKHIKSIRNHAILDHVVNEKPLTQYGAYMWSFGKHSRQNSETEEQLWRNDRSSGICQDKYFQDLIVKCPACKEKHNKILLAKAQSQRLEAAEIELQQSKNLLQETLLEMEELKDDMQRLKAELRAVIPQAL